MTRKTTSIKIDSELWKRVKKHCIDAEKDVSEYLEELIKKDLGSKK
jgi:predicted DNA-binding protein